MGIIRSFDVECDKCGHNAGDSWPYATALRQTVKQDGWTISGNKFTCGNCNGNWTPEPEGDAA